MLKPAPFLLALFVGSMLSFGCFDQAGALPLAQGSTLDLAGGSSDLAVKIEFGCWRVGGKLVCGQKKKKTGQPKEELPKPAPVEETCQGGMVGKPPNCQCPDGTVAVVFKGCVPVVTGQTKEEHVCPDGYVVLDKPNEYGAYCEPIPQTPAPSSGGAHYCITCGGPGCLQKAPACPSGGLTTCTDVPGKTYYNCCCN